MQGTEGEFQFLLCGKCQSEARDPKLLSCLHTLCSECIDESKPIGHCPVCQVSVSRFQDNLLFRHLQANLNTFQKIVANKDLACSRCKEEAEFWCPECKEFLCVRCHEAHQWYLKQKSHEAQKIGDVKADSAATFLAGARKSCTLFCSNPNHSSQGQRSSIYCRQCRKPLCCSCALLDSGHSKFYCDISVEIQQRKEELGRMSEDLREKERCYEQTYGTLQQKEQQVETMCNETRALIQEKVEAMVQKIRKKGDHFMEEVDRQFRKKGQETQGKLQAIERMLHRMKTSKQLVEKMASFASDQEVMDMHPFIKESLDELRKEQVPTVELRVQTRTFAVVKDQLRTLCDKVMGEKDTAAVSNVTPPAPAMNTEAPHNEINHPTAQGLQMPTYTLHIEKNPHGFTPSMSTPRKRPLSICEKSIQTPPKTLKPEADEIQEGETSARCSKDVETCPPCPCERTPEKDLRVIVSSGDRSALGDRPAPGDCSATELCESEAASIVISSSEDSDVDSM